jgi:hypothetical protein
MTMEMKVEKIFNKDHVSIKRKSAGGVRWRLG